MNTELKRMMGRIKDAQVRLQKIVKDQDWVDEARRYAEKQGHEVKKLFSSDIDKVKTFIERERKELERFQKQIPGEVKKIRAILVAQRDEFEKILGGLGKHSRANGAAKAKKAGGSSKTAHGTSKKAKSAASTTKKKSGTAKHS